MRSTEGTWLGPSRGWIRRLSGLSLTRFREGGTHHGTAEVQGYLTRSRAGWAEGRSEPERFIAAGDRIVVFVHARFRGKGSAEWGEVRLADVYTFRDGRPVQMRAFADREEALRWAGVKDPKLGM
jgi:ketosteroid isomerase-like protein